MAHTALAHSPLYLSVCPLASHCGTCKHRVRCVCAWYTQVGCLFDIFSDPEERHDLAHSQPERAAAMYERMVELDRTVYQPDRGAPDHEGACRQVVANGGYFGPWLPTDS